MSEAEKLDLGAVKVHKRVLAEIVASCVSGIKGVSLPSGDLMATVQGWLGIKRFPGISVLVDKNNQVSIEVRIAVLYGLNIPQVAKQTQDMIREAIEKTVEIDLKDVHVNIQGITKSDE